MGFFDMFKSPTDTIDWEVTDRKYKECKDFASIGDKITYLDQEVYVVGYNKTEHIFRVGTFSRVGINVEWFNADRELQRAFISHSDLKLCKNISDL